MPRDYRVYLDDVIEAASKINSYLSGYTFEQFSADSRTVDAVVRNLEVIGEAVKHLPESVRNEHAHVEWKKIAGLRDILIHEYFGINTTIIWDISTRKLPPLLKEVKDILEGYK